MGLAGTESRLAFFCKTDSCMRAISFALTTDQIRNRTKTVTRRIGWWNLKAGTLLWGVKKAMGLKPGETHERLTAIVVVDVRTEPLCCIENEPDGAVQEGFPEMTPREFVEMFCRHASSKKCEPSTSVQRIEFRYLPGSAQPA